MQQLIATGKSSAAVSARGLFSKARLRLGAYLRSLLHAMLWFVHGCPRVLGGPSTFTPELLAKECEQQKWQYLQASHLSERAVGDFILRAAPDLIVSLGDVPALPSDCSVPPKGWIRACVNEFHDGVDKVVDKLHIRIESVTEDTSPPHSLASLTLPRQAYDSMLGFTLKADLVIDDMLSQAVVAMRTGNVRQASKDLAQWIADIWSPCLAQLGPSPTATQRQPLARQRAHSVWSLGIETILLCSPAVLIRNWLRRWRGCYPVLILAHHLVSDRGHRLSMSTEAFWRQARFLLRHYRIVGLSEAADSLRSGRVHTPTVVLTFDDGYADNFVSLRAVAEEVSIPVSLFITTEPVELHREFQHDLSRGDHGVFPMTWNQIRYWKARGAEFGSHTRTHVKCGAVAKALLRDEIVGSKIDFENNLGAAPDFFAFPYGNRENIPPEAVELAVSVYPYFLSCFGGENFPSDAADHSHLLRKMAYANPWELELELQSVFDFVKITKRALHVRHGKSPTLLGQTKPATGVAALECAANLDETANQLVPGSSRPIQRLVKPS